MVDEISARPAAQRAVEGVRVGVDEAGQERGARVTVGGGPAFGYGFDPAIVARDHLEAGLEAAAGPGQVGFDDLRAHAAGGSRVSRHSTAPLACSSTSRSS